MEQGYIIKTIMRPILQSGMHVICSGIKTVPLYINNVIAKKQ